MQSPNHDWSAYRSIHPSFNPKSLERTLPVLSGQNVLSGIEEHYLNDEVYFSLSSPSF